MTLRFASIALFAVFAASTNAFSLAPLSARTVASPRTQLQLMSPEEVDELMGHANDCAEGECSLDEVTELISILKGQQKELYDRVENVKKMIASLETVNAAEDRKVDEVRDTVRAIYRVFQLGDKASGNDYPSLTKPTGWSGEVGEGAKTAYDVLPPKKWKNPESS